VSCRARRLPLLGTGLRAVICFRGCVLAWLGWSASQCSGPRRGTFGSPHRRASERRAMLAAPPYRRAGLRAMNACQEPGLGREVAPSPSAP
jgi:hypothetical protein